MAEFTRQEIEAKKAEIRERGAPVPVKPAFSPEEIAAKKEEIRERNKPSAMGAFSRGLRQSATIGTWDNLVGIYEGVKGLIKDGDFWGPGLKAFNEEQATLAEDRKHRPWAAIGGEIVGASVPGAAVAKIAQPAVGAIRKAVLGGTAAGIESYAMSADTAEPKQGFPGAWVHPDRIKDTATGFALGGALEAAPDIARRFIPGTREIGANRADSAIANVLQNTRQTAQEVTDELAGKPEVMRTIDLNQHWRDLGETAMLSGGDDITKAEQFLAQRDIDGIGRILDGARRAFGIQPGDVRAWKNNLIEKFEKESSDIYNQLNAVPVDARGQQKLGELFYNPQVQKALKDVDTEIDIASTGIPNVARNQPGTMGYWNEVYKVIGDDVGSMIDKGKPAAAARRMKVQRQLRDIMNDIDPDFAAARNKWADAQQMKNAFDLGKSLDVTKGGQSAGNEIKDVLEYFQTATTTEKELFRAGFFDGLDSNLLKMEPGSVKKTRWLNSALNKRFIKEVYGDAAFDIIDDVMTDEKMMRESIDQLMRNSATAKRMIRNKEIQAADLQSDETIAAIVRGAALPTPGNLADVFNRLGVIKKVLEGQKTNQELTRTLVLTRNLTERFNRLSLTNPRKTSIGTLAGKGAAGGASREYERESNRPPLSGE